MARLAGSKAGFAVTVTVCGRYQLAALNTSDDGAVSTWPSVLIATVTSDAGAWLRRTV